jgi:hypothetical protein
VEKTRAWEQLNDPEYCVQLTMGEFERLLLRAGYSTRDAHESAMERGWQRLSAGLMM